MDCRLLVGVLERPRVPENLLEMLLKRLAFRAKALILLVKRVEILRDLPERGRLAFRAPTFLERLLLLLAVLLDRFTVRGERLAQPADLLVDETELAFDEGIHGWQFSREVLDYFTNED